MAIFSFQGWGGVLGEGGGKLCKLRVNRRLVVFKLRSGDPLNEKIGKGRPVSLKELTVGSATAWS